MAATSARCSRIADTSPAAANNRRLSSIRSRASAGRPCRRQVRPSIRSDQPRSKTAGLPRCRSTDSASSFSAPSRSPVIIARMPCSQRVRAVPVGVAEIGEQLLAAVGEVCGLGQPALLPDGEGEVVQRLGQRGGVVELLGHLHRLGAGRLAGGQVPLPVGDAAQRRRAPRTARAGPRGPAAPGPHPAPRALRGGSPASASSATPAPRCRRRAPGRARWPTPAPPAGCRARPAAGPATRPARR